MYLRQGRASIVSVSPRLYQYVMYLHLSTTTATTVLHLLCAYRREYVNTRILPCTNAHATRRACAQTRDTHGGSFSHKPWRFTLSSGRIYPSANCCNLANVPCNSSVCVRACARACASVYSSKLIGNETTRLHQPSTHPSGSSFFPPLSSYFSHNTQSSD